MSTDAIITRECKTWCLIVYVIGWSLFQITFLFVFHSYLILNIFFSMGQMCTFAISYRLDLFVKFSFSNAYTYYWILYSVLWKLISTFITVTCHTIATGIRVSTSHMKKGQFIIFSNMKNLLAKNFPLKKYKKYIFFRSRILRHRTK